LAEGNCLSSVKVEITKSGAASQGHQLGVPFFSTKDKLYENMADYYNSRDRPEGQLLMHDNLMSFESGKNNSSKYLHTSVVQ
jgi:hypothetical protein